MLSNLFRECGVVKQLQETASNAMMYIVVILLGTSVGASTSAEAFLNVSTLKIVALGLIAFVFGTAGGVLLGKILCKATHGRINPLIGSAGVSAVPMAARVSQKVVLRRVDQLPADACNGDERAWRYRYSRSGPYSWQSSVYNFLRQTKVGETLT